MFMRKVVVRWVAEIESSDMNGILEIVELEVVIF